MVGAVVAVCGPIGFVGLMAPHICRLIVGPDHRRLYPATLLFGGAFLVICDTAARTVMAPTELPVGIITALLGGPFFLWLLLAAGRISGRCENAVSPRSNNRTAKSAVSGHQAIGSQKRNVATRLAAAGTAARTLR